MWGGGREAPTQPWRGARSQQSEGRPSSRRCGRGPATPASQASVLNGEATRFLAGIRQHVFCVWLLGAVHVSGRGSCRPRRHWQNRDHQGPGQSPGLALCCHQLRRRHGLQSKALAPSRCHLVGQRGRVGSAGRRSAHALPCRGVGPRAAQEKTLCCRSLGTGPALLWQQHVEQVSWASVPGRGR